MQFIVPFRWLIVSAIVTVFIASCTGDSSVGKSLSSELLEREREAITKEFKNDTSFLSSLMDSTFIELSKQGLKNKHEVLRTIWEDNLRNEKENRVRDSFKLLDPVVHVYDCAGVVTFVIKTFNRIGDSSFTRSTRFYDVWVKRGNDWKAITWQGSPLDY